MKFGIRSTTRSAQSKLPKYGRIKSSRVFRRNLNRTIASRRGRERERERCGKKTQKGRVLRKKSTISDVSVVCTTLVSERAAVRGQIYSSSIPQWRALCLGLLSAICRDDYVASSRIARNGAARIKNATHRACERANADVSSCSGMKFFRSN